LARQKLMILCSCTTDSEGFPLWAYFAIAGIVLFFALVAAVIAICRARKANRKPGKARHKDSEKSRVTHKSLVHLH